MSLQHSENRNRQLVLWLLVIISLTYFAYYFAAQIVPGNNLNFPLGWWGWADQSEYLKSVKAFAGGNYDSNQHFYPPLYSAIGSLFYPWFPLHPFWLLNLVCLLLYSWVFVLVASRYLPVSLACGIFIASVLLNGKIFENFYIPWTSTLLAALLSIGFWALHHELTKPSGENHNGKSSTPFISILKAIIVSTCLGLIAALRPLDAIMGGVVWLVFILVRSGLSFNETQKTNNSALFKQIICYAPFLSIGTFIFFIFNYLVHGSLLGRYYEVATANGYFPSDLTEKFVSIWLDGFSLYLEPNSSLIAQYPWLTLSLVGMVFAVRSREILACTIAAVIVVQFALYLPYADLLPTGIWRYKVIHYFKWMFPYLALFAAIALKSLYEIWRKDKTSAILWSSISMGLIFLLASLTFKINYIPLISSKFIRETENSLTVEIKLSPTSIDLIDINHISGGFPSIYFGNHALEINKKKLTPVKDYRVLPSEYGIRILLIRPTDANDIQFKLGANLFVDKQDLSAFVGSYKYSYRSVPQWTIFQKDPTVVSGYNVGNIIDFSIEGAADQYLSSGWSHAEEFGRWTDGAEAKIYFKPVVADENLTTRLELEAAGFFSYQNQIHNIDVFVNNAKVGILKLEQAKGDTEIHKITLHIPKGVILSNVETEIRMHIPNAVTPKSVGLNDDVRLLGLYVKSLRLEQLN